MNILNQNNILKGLIRKHWVHSSYTDYLSETLYRLEFTEICFISGMYY